MPLQTDRATILQIMLTAEQQIAARTNHEVRDHANARAGVLAGLLEREQGQPPPQPGIVPVTQEDREAAADLYRDWHSNAHDQPMSDDSPTIKTLRTGGWDICAFVQAFAHHRIDAFNAGKASVELNVETVCAYESGVKDGMRRAAKIAMGGQSFGPRDALARGKELGREEAASAILTETERGERG